MGGVFRDASYITMRKQLLDKDTILAGVDLLELARHDTDLGTKKIAGSGGGEWAGPCPFCGGEDRFRVQPYKKPHGIWLCRNCTDGKWDTAAGYVMRRDNCNFITALETLSMRNFIVSAGKILNDTQDNNRAQWETTANEFLQDSIKHLWQPEGAGALEYLHKRGLNDDTLRMWNIGYSPEKGICDAWDWGVNDQEEIWIPRGIIIPCEDENGLQYLKIRQNTTDHKKRYTSITGSHAALFGAWTLQDVFTAFLFEGEFDVMLAYQTGFTGCGYCSMPAGKTLQEDWYPLFAKIDNLIIAMDNDEEGEKAAKELLNLSDQFIKASPLPTGKDLTEYLLSGGDVFEWLYSEVGRLGALNG